MSSPRPASSPAARSGLIGWWDARRGGVTVILAWLVTRALMFAILAAFESFIVGDVYYYHRKITGLFEVGLPGTLMEYPTPVVWILTLPYAVGLGDETAYLVAFMVFMLVLDAAFTYAVWRSGGRRHDAAVDFWLLFVFLVGPLSYVRFDMIPAVLAGGALLVPWPSRREPAPGAVVGSAAELGEAIMGSHMLVMLTVSPAMVATIVGGVVLAQARGRYDRLGDDLYRRPADDPQPGGVGR